MLLLLLFLAAVAMVVIIKALLPAFIHDCSGEPSAWYGNSILVTIACLCLIFPFCMKENITVLRYTSALALCCLAYYFSCLAVRFLNQKGGPHVHDTVRWYNDDFFEILDGWSIMVAAYLCHFNIFKIDAELGVMAKPKIWRVVRISIPGIATSIYLVG